MSSVCLLIASVMVAVAPQVQVTTLQEKKHIGSLEQLSSQQVVVKTTSAATPVKIPASNLMSIQFLGKPALSPAANSVLVALIDGTRLACSSITTTSTKASLQTTAYGKLQVSLQHVSSILYNIKNPTQSARWKELCAKSKKKDYVVTLKNGKLNYFSGVVGRIASKGIPFALGAGAPIMMKPSNIYGIIYSRLRKAKLAESVCHVKLTNSDSLHMSQLQLTAEKLTGRLRTGMSITVAMKSILSLDYGSSKIHYLSAMTPRQVKFTSLYNDPHDAQLFHYRKDHGFQHGTPLRLAGKDYSRGLWVYSRTSLTYPLLKKYRVFHAVLGIDDHSRKGDARVVISGDGKILYKADIRHGEKPILLNLDVSSVSVLEILVDYGRDNKSEGDHVDFANARVIK